MGQKAPKGSVSIIKEAGRIRLRWRCNGRRFSVNLFAYSKANLLQAKKIAVNIEQDILSGNFDRTLEKYRNGEAKDLPAKRFESPISLFELWVKEYRNRDCDKHKNYHTLRAMLKRWGDFTPEEIPKRLNQEQIAPKTYNRRLTMLKSFMDWLVNQGYIPQNPLREVQTKKSRKQVDQKRVPLSSKEIQLILETFKNDTFCPRSSHFKHSHYYPFLYFMFATGVRNAEAIGLRVKNVNIEQGYIEIKEVLARSLKGSHASERVRKETKNGKERRIPLDKKLQTILQPLLLNKQKDDLVFTSPKGGVIDDKMFQRRIFKQVLEKLSIPERVLYACRHTFTSRCIEAGITPVMTAFLLGNNAETALRNYTHFMGLPDSLPEL